MQTTASLYMRTTKGRVLAFGPTGKLPEKLKILLQAIDGRTESRIISKQFFSYGNVASMLDELETAGLIEAKDSSPRAASYGQDTEEIWGLPKRTQAHSGLHIVQGANTNTVNMQSLLSQPTRRQDAWQATAASGLEDSPGSSLEHYMQELTQQIADIMATFVLTYLPNSAYVLLRELEDLRSPGQLQATLPGYEALVATTGLPGHQHIAELRQLIAQQFREA
jgi:hypothetical protein